MEKNDPVLIVSNADSFRYKFWEHFDNLGFSVNLERSIENGVKRVVDGVYTIIIIDEKVYTKANESGWLNGFKPRYWENFFLIHKEEWEKFKKPPLILIIKESDSEEKITQSLNEIVQASFLSHSHFISFPCSCYNVNSLV